MRSAFPLQVELVDLLVVLRPDDLRDDFELLPEGQDCFLENSNFLRRPVLEHIGVSEGVDQHIQILLLVDCADRV